MEEQAGAPVDRAHLTAHVAVLLSDRSAEDLGWPDRTAVARHFASAVLSGLSREQFGNDPAGWCIEVLHPAIERRLNDLDGDLRSTGWPNTPSAAATIVGWLLSDGVLSQQPVR